MESLVRPDGVVGVFPGQELLVQGGHLQREVVNLISRCIGTRYGCAGPRSMSRRVGTELRGAGWQDEELEASALALRLKGCLELGAASTWMARTGKGIYPIHHAIRVHHPIQADESEKARSPQMQPQPPKQ